MKNAMLIILGLFICIQFIQTDKTNPPVDTKQEIVLPQEIYHIFQKACYDCHSNETRWPWYSYIAPMSWTIKSHVDDGRKSVNYSIWNTYSEEKQENLLQETFRTVYAAMPLPSYITFHKEADLTKEERKMVRDYILSLKEKVSASNHQ